MHWADVVLKRGEQLHGGLWKPSCDRLGEQGLGMLVIKFRMSTWLRVEGYLQILLRNSEVGSEIPATPMEPFKHKADLFRIFTKRR